MPVSKTIFYHDTDAGGVVYYGRYLNFLEEARTVFLDELGFPVKQLNDAGVIFAVRSCHVQYKKPARYGDVIQCDARINTLKPARIVFQQQIVDASTAQLLVDATVELVAVNPAFKPIPIPASLYHALTQLKQRDNHD